jgi:CBS domain containing-hemolysin-like protein
MEAFGEAWIGLGTGILVFLLLVVGEISPKQIALSYNETVAWHTGDILYVLLLVLKPFVQFISFFSNLLSSLFKGKTKKSLTIEEILQMTSLAENIGILQRQERSVFQSIIRSGNSSVASIVTHRRNIVSFEITESLEKIYPIILKEEYEYFPLWEGNPENIVGILYLQEVMRAAAEGKSLKDISLAEISHDPVFIPASKKIKDLFHLFAASDTHMLICLDEFGGLTGILTKDNLLREILGELYDPEEKPEISIHQKAANFYEVKGETPVYDFEEFFNLELNTKAQTMGGYLLDIIDRIPQDNEVISTEFGKFVVKGIKNNRILFIYFILFEDSSVNS